MPELTGFTCFCGPQYDSLYGLLVNSGDEVDEVQAQQKKANDGVRAARDARFAKLSPKEHERMQRESDSQYVVAVRPSGRSKLTYDFELLKTAEPPSEAAKHPYIEVVITHPRVFEECGTVNTLFGIPKIDASKARGAVVTKGLKRKAAVTVPRDQHQNIKAEIDVVPMASRVIKKGDELKKAAELGWTVPPPVPLTPSLRTKYTNADFSSTNEAEQAALLRELKARNLDKKPWEGTIDYVKRWTGRIMDFITYNAPASFEQNAGKPIWNTFNTKVAHCGTYSFLLVCSLRAFGIPARSMVGFGGLDGTQTHCTVEVYIDTSQTWLSVEPQSRGSVGQINPFTATASIGVLTMDDIKDNHTLRPWAADAEAWASQVFKRADADGNGYISKDEVQGLMEALFPALRSTKADDSMQRMMDDAIKKLDVDGDGRITKDEFVKQMVSPSGGGMASDFMTNATQFAMGQPPACQVPR